MESLETIARRIIDVRNITDDDVINTKLSVAAFSEILLDAGIITKEQAAKNICNSYSGIIIDINKIIEIPLREMVLECIIWEYTGKVGKFLKAFESLRDAKEYRLDLTVNDEVKKSYSKIPDDNIYLKIKYLIAINILDYGVSFTATHFDYILGLDHGTLYKAALKAMYEIETHIDNPKKLSNSRRLELLKFLNEC